ncbi:hypothetical protein HMPREF9530_00338, partial [Escherichia coli MS 21-1]
VTFTAAHRTGHGDSDDRIQCLRHIVFSSVNNSSFILHIPYPRLS